LLRHIGRFACVAMLIGLGACTDGQKTARESLAGGYSAFSGGQYVQAESAADEYIAKYPRDSVADEAYYLRGLSRMALGKRTAAVADLQNAIALSDREDLKAKANRALGDSAYESGQYDVAEKYYLACAYYYGGQKKEALVLFRLGATLQAQGKWDDARPWFQKVLELHPEASLIQRSLVRRDRRYFSLQFGAFKNPAMAQNLARQLQTAGLQAFVDSEVRENDLIFLIRAGQYNTFREATAARDSMLARYPMAAVIPF
jgi:tetratricopeptide (TPR) repeat protein